MTQYSGYTADTPDHLLLDSGAFYKNYDVTTGTGTLLGATRGGGEFVAKPTIRSIPVDGVKGRAKGLNVIDAWEVSIKASMLEITTNALKYALAASDVNTSDATYDVVTARTTVTLADYIDNITWIGRLSGSNNPIILQIFNAMNTDGVTLQMQDKNEGVLPLLFLAHYDATDLNTVPFKIYYPKVSGDTTAPTVTTSPADEATGFSVSANIVWTFSEAIQPSSVTAGNFMVMKASDGSVIAGLLTQSADKTTVTFDPSSNLTAATTYITVASTNVKDLAGNALATNSVTNFTTA